MKEIKDVSDIIHLLGDHERKGVDYAFGVIKINELSNHRIEVFKAIDLFIKKQTK